jgi:hypothetical protein
MKLSEHITHDLSNAYLIEGVSQHYLVGGANITNNNISFPLHYYSDAIRIMRKNMLFFML